MSALPLEPVVVFRRPLESYDTGVLELAAEDPASFVGTTVPVADLWLPRMWIQAELHRREARAERRQRAPKRRVA